MYRYLGLIVAVENYHNDVPQVKYATDDAVQFRNSLIALGCQEDRLKLLTNEKATKTTIEQSIKEIASSARETDTIVFYFAGHGYYYNGKNLITCVDSSQKFIPETTVGLDFILDTFDKSSSNKVIAFLDCCHSGIQFDTTERSPLSDFSIDELKYYDNAEHLAVFASCKGNEKSHTDLQRKHGAWSYYLLEALRGNADNSIYDNGFLFSDKLQKYLGINTFQRVKQITPDKKNQTPIKFGKETAEKFIVADLKGLFEERSAKIKTEGIRFEQATILTTEEDYVRNLPGFNKDAGHKAPKVINNYHENWIKKIAQKLIEDELNRIGDELKTKLKYKRKDIEAPVVDDGVGQLSTIDFDYVISVSQSQTDADTYVLTRSIENFKNSDILTNPEFNRIFENTFNELEFILSEKLNVENVIDKIEEIDDEDLISVEYEHIDTSACKVYIKGLNGYIDLKERSFKIVSNRKESPEKLVLSFKETYKVIEQQKIPKMLF